MLWTVDAPNVGFPPHVLSLPESGRVPGSAARAACREVLNQGKTGAAVAQLLREMDLFFPAKPHKIADPAQPVCGQIELAVPDEAGGIFVAGWIRDPCQMVNSASLTTPFGRVELSADRMARLHRPDIEKDFAKAAHHAPNAVQGFIAHVSNMPGGQTLQPNLLLQLRSGAQLQLTPPARSFAPAAARDAVLGCVPLGHMTPAMMERCIAPAAARLHRAAMSNQDTIEVIRIGPRVGKPSVSIVVPLYRNLGFLRFQVSALAQDRDCRGADIIYVLDSPEQRREVEHLLWGLHRLTGLSLTLVVMPRNLGYAAATNAGAQQAGAPVLLLLNSDVIPSAPGWLGILRSPLARAGIGAAGPKLLFDDSSIQHAGLFFERDETGSGSTAITTRGCPATGRVLSAGGGCLASPAPPSPFGGACSRRLACRCETTNRLLQGIRISVSAFARSASPSCKCPRQSCSTSSVARSRCMPATPVHACLALQSLSA